jgi:NAD(P)-dependent dehydrogenase (short-subunit alcohol dehydrogenase family)
MRPVDQQTILITGSTDGLGRETARELVGRGATVMLHGRDPEKLEPVRTELAEAGGGRVHGYVADFSSLAEVERLAEEVTRDTDHLHVLINNAGVGGIDRGESRDGYELHMAVNHLAHFLLTGRLLPLLRESAPARVVNVASGAQTEVDFDDLFLERGYNPMRAYAQSKLAQVMFTFELAERLGDNGVTVNALHPASLMDTNMVRDNFGSPMTGVAEGVEATARLAVSPELEGVTGRYFEGTGESRADAQAYAREARRRLWEESERLVGAELAV